MIRRLARTRLVKDDEEQIGLLKTYSEEMPVLAQIRFFIMSGDIPIL